MFVGMATVIPLMLSDGRISVSEMSARLMPLSRYWSRHCSVYGLYRSWPSAIYYCWLQISLPYIFHMAFLYRYHCWDSQAQLTILLIRRWICAWIMSSVLQTNLLKSHPRIISLLTGTTSEYSEQQKQSNRCCERFYELSFTRCSSNGEMGRSYV